ncbi:LuxR C-terminal-related transcriptional regulator [Amycolatopsis sp. ATCC 39116]|uniref:LuxR C-terminal-related transcriptional regulator n=1 Tax=Amycolatopsis sp. (strain ATCC 39116 / 75iv2) TaxID=385957 RepID=UPI0002629044|nr:LuxR C-terminal-related transcriptional regulator [Amycolatopsis sp. ATCC 39116]
MARVPGNLPGSESVSSFVGRRAAVAEVRALLGAARLVTLLGPGGMGKTRLAVHVAESVRRGFPDGVWLVELADLRDPDMVGHAVVDALGVVDQSMTSSETVLTDHLRGKKLLLVLDNCEHVLDACARLAATILRAAPHVRILATSREALHAPGEHVWAVPPLSVPEQGLAGLPARKLLEFEAVELFAQRAAAAVPGFELTPENREGVARLCARLDGMPLAIELAAVRLQALGVTEILDLLENHFQALPTVVRGAPERHQTLRAAVDWSYTLCTPAEQAVWARVSVFSGGFDLGAAVAVCADADLSAPVVIDALTALVGKSVVIREPHSAPAARYRMLETIRQFGLEVLHESGAEPATRARHRDHYARQAAQAWREWSGPAQLTWSAKLRRDQNNLRAALQHAFDHDPPDGARMATDLGYLWVCGASREGRRWLDRAVEVLAEETPDRSRALWVSGWVRQIQGDAAASAAALNECLRSARQLGDDEAVSRAEQFLGIHLLLGNRLAQAETLLTSAMSPYRDGASWDSVSLIGLAALGWLQVVCGRAEEAERTCQECRRLSAELGERWAASWALWVLGLIGWSRREPQPTFEVLRECIGIKRELGDWFGIPCAVEVLVWVMAEAGDHERAARLLGANRQLWLPVGQPMFGFAPYLEAHEKCASQLRAALGDARFEQSHAQGQHLAADEAVSCALGTPEAPPERGKSPLTRRERQVADLVAEGLTNREIAETLVVSQRTAESHVENILNKLGYHSRTQIAAWVRERPGGSP